MKKLNYRHILTTLLLVVVTIGITNAFSSCGTMRSYWGVENEYDWGEGSHHHHHKHKKHKHRKKHKHHHHHND